MIAKGETMATKKSNFIIVLGFLVMLAGLLILSGCSNPVGPEMEAKIEVDVRTIAGSLATPNWWLRLEITVTESGGVGGRIETCAALGWDDDRKVWQFLFPGGSFNALGTLTVPVEMSSDIPFDWILITVMGKDDNGHDIEASETLVYIGAAAEVAE